MTSGVDVIRPVSVAEELSLHIRRNAAPALLSGFGRALAIWLLAALTENLGQIILIAPFGASCLLLFALPQSPLARPRNVIGGHLISTLAGLLVLTFLGNGVVATGLGVGLTIVLMQFSGTHHPPAGGDPLVVIIASAGWSFLLLPIAVGTVALVLLDWLYHRFVSKRAVARETPTLGPFFKARLAA